MLKNTCLLLLPGLLVKNELVARKLVKNTAVVDITITDDDVLYNESNGLMVSQISNIFSEITRTGIGVIYNTDNVILDNHLKYQPLAASGYFTIDYSKANFFLQPLLILEYYFSAILKKLNAVLLINAGVIF